MSTSSDDTLLLLVTGSRSIKDAGLVGQLLDELPFVARVTQVVHGGAPGVDTLAGQWAQRRQLPCRVVRPDFKTWPIARHRWRAYTERDRAMVDQASTVVAIWDGKSSGTRFTFEYARSLGKLASVYNTATQQLTRYNQ